MNSAPFGTTPLCFMLSNSKYQGVPKSRYHGEAVEAKPGSQRFHTLTGRALCLLGSSGHWGRTQDSSLPAGWLATVQIAPSEASLRPLRSTTPFYVPQVLLLVISYQNLRNNASIVHMASCRILIINSSLFPISLRLPLLPLPFPPPQFLQVQLNTTENLSNLLVSQGPILDFWASKSTPQLTFEIQQVLHAMLYHTILYSTLLYSTLPD